VVIFKSFKSISHYYDRTFYFTKQGAYMRHVLLVAIGCSINLGAIACSEHQLEAYTQKASQLKQAILSEQSASAQVVMAESRQLMIEAKSILADFIVQTPQCGTYLGATISVSESLLEMTPEVIKLQYQQEQALPKALPACQPVKDLLVSPAIAYAFAKQGNQGWQVAAVKEIEHVLKHEGVVVVKSR
jgi:hypothetical protein